MKIVIITQGVSRIVVPLFAEFEIVGVVESAKRGYVPECKQSPITLLKNLYQRLFKRKKSLQNFCEGKVVPYRLLTKENDEEVCRWLSCLKPDLIVVFSMSQLLRKNILSVPKLGVINLHPSYLPEYRGPNPDFWQYYHCEQNPGITVHYVDQGEDTGHIIRQERVHIPLGTKSPARLDKLVGEVGVRILIQAIRDIETGCIKPIPQPAVSPTQKARNIKPDEHQDIIDWHNWPVQRIWNVLRGTELWLNAIDQPSGIYRGHRWSVGNYEELKAPIGVSAGTVFKDAGRFYVACTAGRIELFINFNYKLLILALLR